MTNENSFQYTYSAPVNQEVLNIRNKYVPHEETKLEELKRLDRLVQNSGVTESLTVGIGGCVMLLAFFVGALIGGAVSGLPFTMDGFHAATLVLCLITKLLLMAVFVPIYVVMSVIAKHRSWMSILLCLMTGMFMFMMIPMLTPLNANLMHVLLCGAGAACFTIGLGAVSNTILKKTSLV